MKKILILLVLCLGILGFSNDGFKNLKWGAPKEDVIKLLGTKYDVDKKDKNKIIYSSVYNKDKLYFANLEFTSLSFIFNEDKMISWEGSGFLSRSQRIKLLDSYLEKYGANFSSYEVGDVGTMLSYYDKNGVIKILLGNQSNSRGDYYINLEYRKPFTQDEVKEWEQYLNFRKNKIKDDI